MYRHCLLPIIFITGHGDVPMGLRAMKAGALAFIAKPFHDHTLLKAVDQALLTDPAEKDSPTKGATLKWRGAFK